MRRLRLLSAVALLSLLLSACDPFNESSMDEGSDEPVAASAEVSAGVATTDQLQRGSDVLARGLTLLTERYVGGADAGMLMAASQTGAWSAIAETGVVPRDVDAPAPKTTVGESLQTFRLRYLRTATRYASKVDPVWLSHEMLRKAADSLDDCHTGFLSAKQVRDQAQRMSGTTQFGGVGVIIRRAPDNVGFLVIEVFDDSPAQKAGLKPGDRIVSVDDENLTGRGIEQVVQLVRGQEGTTVTLGVARAGQDQPAGVQMTRAQVAAPILKAQIIDGTVGYLRFYSFPEPLTGQVDQALREFDRRDIRAVIVDLRDNSGGQLDVVTKLTSRFVKDGPLFQGVSTTGEKRVYQADGSYWREKPLVVLTNAGTASGGEIFAAAVKEHRAGVLIGTTTAGCVSTGQGFPLPDGSALEIATNRVLTGIGGVELNKVGVSPNVQVPVTPTDVVSERELQLAKALEIIQRG
jgi:carboxyl-terminal processing protease